MFILMKCRFDPWSGTTVCKPSRGDFRNCGPFGFGNLYAGGGVYGPAFTAYNTALLYRDRGCPDYNPNFACRTTPFCRPWV